MKDTKKITKKLALNKETVRQLDKSELTEVAGGRPNETRMTQCDCVTFTCDQ